MNRRDLLRTALGTALLAACRRPTPAVADAGDHDHDTLPDVAPAAACVATADNIEGPFFKRGAPHRAVLADGDTPGQPLALAGTVRSTDCTILPGATLQVWHADHRGDYDLDGFRFRAALRADADGAWQVRTIVPGRYLNGRRYRPAHVHVKLAAPGHRPLTTQLYFEGDPYNDGDPFIVPSLVMPHRTRGGITRARFDFVLERA